MSVYAEVSPEVAGQLKAIVGEANFQFGEDVNEDFSRDEMPIYGTKMPQAVVFPANTQEVSEVMKLCFDNDIPVTVRGAGTGLVGGCTPLVGGVVLFFFFRRQLCPERIQCYRRNPERPQGRGHFLHQGGHAEKRRRLQGHRQLRQLVQYQDL